MSAARLPCSTAIPITCRAPNSADGLSGARVAKVDRVEWRVIPDAATAAAALQNGEVDIWEQPALDLVPLLSQNRSVRVQRALNLSIQAFLRPNALYPPFDNPKARLALAYIVDQADVMAAGYGDEKFWRRCNAYYVCGGPHGTEAGTEDLKPDLAKARALLAEAGYHGEMLVFSSTHEIAWVGHMTEVVVDELKQAGMNVDVIWADWGTAARRQVNQNPPSAGGWNLFVGASGVDDAPSVDQYRHQHELRPQEFRRVALRRTRGGAAPGVSRCR